MWAIRPLGKEVTHPGAARAAREKHVRMVREGSLEEEACAVPCRAGDQEQGSQAGPQRQPRIPNEIDRG